MALYLGPRGRGYDQTREQRTWVSCSETWPWFHVFPARWWQLASSFVPYLARRYTSSCFLDPDGVTVAVFQPIFGSVGTFRYVAALLRLLECCMKHLNISDMARLQIRLWAEFSNNTEHAEFPE
jgi:hypothetical protein